MKIKVLKNVTVMGKEMKKSSKGNSYSVLNCFDEEGRVHSLYCPGNVSVVELNSMEKVEVCCEITYKEKYDKIELISFKKID